MWGQRGADVAMRMRQEAADNVENLKDSKATSKSGQAAEIRKRK